MVTTKVFRMSDGDLEQVYSLPPTEAVIAAHAQSLGDWNTWDYAEKYGKLVEYGSSGFTVYCGNFAAGLVTDVAVRRDGGRRDAV